MTITKNELSKMLNENWHCIDVNLFEKHYWNSILSTLNLGVFYPKKEHIFAALNHIDPKDVKVLILGQDPYHSNGQAHGYSFSVQNGAKIPPSLRNIIKELQRSYMIPKINFSGDLRSWSDEGVLLLNSILSVSPGKPLSHKDIGWELFTTSIIEYIAKSNPNCVYLAWGGYANKTLDSIKKQYDIMIISCGHPSPLNTSNPFVGSDVFIETNRLLLSKNKRPIRWSKIFS